MCMCHVRVRVTNTQIHTCWEVVNNTGKVGVQGPNPILLPSNPGPATPFVGPVVTHRTQSPSPTAVQCAPESIQCKVFAFLLRPLAQPVLLFPFAISVMSLGHRRPSADSHWLLEASVPLLPTNRLMCPGRTREVASRLPSRGPTAPPHCGQDTCRLSRPPGRGSWVPDPPPEWPARGLPGRGRWPQPVPP